MQRRLALVRERIVKWVLPPPRGCEDGLYSMILPVNGNESNASEYLMDVALSAIDKARRVTLSDVTSRMKCPPRWPEYWPGEHYRLLAGLVDSLKPACVIEVGTYTGLSALSMKKYLPTDGVLTTFDIKKWNAFPDSCLRECDFEDGRLVQLIGDLSDPVIMSKHAALIAKAELIFVDAPKDGVFEKRFLQNLSAIEFPKAPLLIFDDIRLWNMLAIWQSIKCPKLDLTSFGHWAGTGLVAWDGPYSKS